MEVSFFAGVNTGPSKTAASFYIDPTRTVRSGTTPAAEDAWYYPSQRCSRMRFLLVDKIYELEPGKRIKASKTLPAGEELFRDHFPGFPIVPGVLLTEMMGQAAQKCLDAEGVRPGLAVLGKIHSASFKSYVRPDEEAVIHAEISQKRDSYAVAKCFIQVNGKNVCSAELFFVFVPDIKLPADYRDDALDAYWRENPAKR